MQVIRINWLLFRKIYYIGCQLLIGYNLRCWYLHIWHELAWEIRGLFDKQHRQQCILGNWLYPSWYLPMHTSLVQCFSYSRLRNTDIRQCKSGLQILSYYSLGFWNLFKYCASCSQGVLVFVHRASVQYADIEFLGYWCTWRIGMEDKKNNNAALIDSF